MKGIIAFLGLDVLAKRLALVDRHLFSVLAARLGPAGLSDQVALVKQTESQRRDNSPLPVILRPDIESKRIALARHWAKNVGVDPNFASTIMFEVMAQSCRVQASCLQRGQHVQALDGSDEHLVRAFQRDELLRLTARVADTYDQDYQSTFFGTQQYLKFERGKISATIRQTPNRERLLELGCATAPVSFLFGSQFKSVHGYDLSPEMIARANQKLAASTHATKPWVFEVADIEQGIALPDRSVSLAVLNFGTASDIYDLDAVLKEIQRVIRADGKLIASFYNENSLLGAFDFLPWPAPVAANIDPATRSLEVHYCGEVFLLHARPYTVDAVKEKLASRGFVTDEINTHPTISAIIPQDILSIQEFQSYGQPETDGHCLQAEITEKRNEKLEAMLHDLDAKLAHTSYHYGAYILAIARRKP